MNAFGSDSRLPFSLLFAVRSLRGGRRLLSALAIMGIALAVALAGSVEMASRSLRVEIGATSEALVGASALEVSAGEVGVPESLLAELRALPTVRSASPLIKATFRLDGGPKDGLPLHVVGVDLLYERELRKIDLEQAGFQTRDVVRLIANTNALIAASTLAERLGIGEGDDVPVRTPNGRAELTIRGTLSGPLARAYGGQVAVMDVFAMQQVLGGNERFDRIDLVPADGTTIEDLKAQIAGVVAGRASVDEPRLANAFQEAVLGTMTLALWAIGLVATVAAGFVTYSVISFAVAQRIGELSLLRAAGLEGTRVARLILVESLCFGAIGTCLGLLLASFLSHPLLTLLSRATGRLDHVELHPAPVSLSTVALAIATGLFTAVVAAAFPARRASRVGALELMERFRPPQVVSASRSGSLALGLCSLLAVALAVGVSGPFPPTVRTTVAVLGAVLSLALLTQPALGPLVTYAQPLFGRILTGTGYLVGTVVARAELGATLATWVAIVGGVTAVYTAVQSTMGSLSELGPALRGPNSIVLFAEDPLATRDLERLWAETVATIVATPGVADVARSDSVELPISGHRVLVESLETDVLVRHGGLVASLSPNREQMLEALVRGDAVASRSFLRTLSLKIGESVQLPTPVGPRTLRIGGVLDIGAGKAGALFVDGTVFREFFGRTGAECVYLWSDGPAWPVLERLSRSVQTQALFFRDPAQMRQHNFQVLARFRALLLAPIGIVAAIGTLALLNLLLGSLQLSGRELGLLRAAGATAHDVRRLILLDGLLVGAGGTGIGLLAGAVWAYVFCGALNETLGWAIAPQFDRKTLVALALGAWALASCAGALPVVGARATATQGIVEST